MTAKVNTALQVGALGVVWMCALGVAASAASGPIRLTVQNALPFARAAEQATTVPAETDDDVQMLRDCITATKDRKHQQKYRAIIAESRGFLGTLRNDARATDLSAEQKKTLADVLKRFKPLVATLEKWDAGQYTLAKVREVRLANRTRAERQRLWEKYLTDCKAKGVAPTARAEWDERWPTRVLFNQDFEKDGDWTGTVTTDNVPPDSAPSATARDSTVPPPPGPVEDTSRLRPAQHGSRPGRRALAAVVPKAYFAQRIRVGIYYDNARTTTTNWVRFTYFINKPVPIGVFVFDMTLHNNWETRIARPVVGAWTEVTLDLATFREKGSRQRAIQPGDAIDDVFIHAGRPGQKDLQLLVDNVTLIGRD